LSTWLAPSAIPKPATDTPPEIVLEHGVDGEKEGAKIVGTFLGISGELKVIV
jgi:hypothetical protein